MILVTGGLGFIGSHTVRALLDLNHACIATRHRSADVLSFLHDDRVVIEPLDLTDRAAVLALGERHAITGIVHLGGALSNPFDELRQTSAALANVLEAASRWKVRACIASAVGVYAGVTGPWREDAAIPLGGFPHPIVAMKKMTEVYIELAAQTGVDCVALRIGGVYGPRYVRGRTFPSRLARAIVNKTALDLAGVMFGVGPDEGGDWCYVRDIARAIALVQTAATLKHRIYNVGSGVAIRNGELVAIARRLVPSANLDGYELSANPPAIAALDINRLRDETGFEPRFTTEAALFDYFAWLGEGHAH